MVLVNWNMYLLKNTVNCEINCDDRIIPVVTDIQRYMKNQTWVPMGASNTTLLCEICMFPLSTTFSCANGTSAQILILVFEADIQCKTSAFGCKMHWILSYTMCLQRLQLPSSWKYVYWPTHITLSMATVIFAKTLNNFHYSMWLTPKSQSFTSVQCLRSHIRLRLGSGH
jgi:hypothetical protein